MNRRELEIVVRAKLRRPGDEQAPAGVAPLEDELTRLERKLEIERSERVRYGRMASKRYDEIKRLTNELEQALKEVAELKRGYTALESLAESLQQQSTRRYNLAQEARAKVLDLERELDEMEGELGEVVELSQARLKIIQRQQAKVQDLEQALAYTRECYHDLKEREGALANLLDNQAKLFEQMERKLAVERDIAADRKIIIQDLEAKVQELEQALAEMLPDKARLDWLDSRMTGRCYVERQPNRRRWIMTHATGGQQGPCSARQALDSARRCWSGADE